MESGKIFNDIKDMKNGNHIESLSINLRMFPPNNIEHIEYDYNHNINVDIRFSWILLTFGTPFRNNDPIIIFFLWIS